MLFHLTASKLIDLRNQSVEELTVMTHYDGCSVKGTNSLFQHILRCHIQMVGRFIKYQQVYWFKQQTYHRQATTFTPTENLHLFIGGLATKHKGAQYIVDTQADITLGNTVDRFEYRQVLIQ